MIAATIRSDAIAGVLAPQRAREVLQGLAIHGMRAQGGYVPDVTLHYGADPDMQEERPLCNPAAAVHLILMLEGYQRQLLEEWLRQLVQRRERVPEQLIPALLETGYERNPLRPAIKRVTGKRALWLQAQAQREQWMWLNQISRSLAAEARPGIERFQRQLCDVIRHQGLSAQVCKALGEHHAIWGDELIRAFFGALQYSMEHQPERKPAFRVWSGQSHIYEKYIDSALVAGASFIPIGRAGEYAAAIGVCIQDLAAENQRGIWHLRLQHICQVLDFRTQMHRAFTQPEYPQ